MAVNGDSAFISTNKIKEKKKSPHLPGLLLSYNFTKCFSILWGCTSWALDWFLAQVCELQAGGSQGPGPGSLQQWEKLWLKGRVWQGAACLCLLET